MATAATMGDTTVGPVTTAARRENLEDLWAARKGAISNDEVRRLELTDALVDTGATFLFLPKRYIQLLGLRKVRDREFVSSHGKWTTAVYDAVRLTIMNRECTLEVMEVPDDVPALIGQIPQEALDLVVNPRSFSLMGNPAHGGERILEAY